MKDIVKHLWLITLLMAAAAFILLLSDLDRRESAKSKTALPSIAVMQFVSAPLLDAHISGIQEALKRRGCLAPDESNLRILNPQGDYAVANAIAREMVQGPYDLLMTSSTVALQIVAKANEKVKKTHVFGAVTDPYGTGVGITGPGEDQHPPYLTGIGTFQPVEQAFRIARLLNPALARVGVVWTPAEQCSEACVKKARAICAELGIELLEANAANATEVKEAAASLLAKRIEAIWIGGDTVAIAAAPMMIRQAGVDHVPVFTNDPKDISDGALFGLGADYHKVGECTGEVAADIIAGRSPSTFRIENVVPEKLALNESLLDQLDGWQMVPEVKARLNEATAEAPKPLEPEPGRTYRIGVSYYVPAPVFDDALAGFRKRLTELGFIEGKNLKLDVVHANGDMSLIPQITRTLLQKDPDILVPFSTPCLGSAISCTKDVNIAFGLVSAPFQAGAGRSFDDHLPNVTGVVQMLPTEELFDRTRKLFPEAARIGALYNPSEANAVKEVEDLHRLFEPRGLTLVSAPISNASEAAEAIQTLITQQIDLMFLMADNTVVSAVPVIVKTCQKQGIPMIADDATLMGSGAIMSCAPGPHHDGGQAAELAVRVLLGTPPAEIPLQPSDHNEFALDLEAAAEQDLALPVEFLQRADLFFNLDARYGRAARIAVLNLADNAALYAAMEGVVQAIQDCGLEKGKDYTLKAFNAQGDMALVPQLIDSALAAKPDVIVTITTPLLMAAVKKIHEVPLVFTVASNPHELGLFEEGHAPPNLCGVYEEPSTPKLLEMVRRHIPGVKAVGTIFDPAQRNAVLSVEALRAAAKSAPVALREATASSVSDLSPATQGLIDQGVEAIIISSDNLTTTGFPAIYKAAFPKGIPIFTTEPELTEQGATGAIGCDYAGWGYQAGRLAAGVLAGIAPNEQPVEPARERVTVEPAPSSS